MLIRTWVVALALALALGACGGDDEPAERDAAGTAPAGTAPSTSGTAPPAGRDDGSAPPATSGEGEGGGSPEDQPGGAGDEEPIRSEAVLEFSRRRGLTPAVVRVPPFIAIKLTVKSTDGGEYDVSVEGPRSAGGGSGSTSSDFDLEGLRPGQRYEVRERGTGSVAVVSASGEAGP